MSEDGPSDFELIRDTLLQLDPDTRAEVVEAMRIIRTLPRPVAVRILTDAGMRAILYAPRLLLA